MLPWLNSSIGGRRSTPASAAEHRDAVQLARSRFAALTSSRSEDEIVFTSCAAESVNLALKGAAFASESRRRILLSSIENLPVLQSAAWLVSRGFYTSKVGVHQDGQLDASALKAILREDAALLCVQLVNPDVGVIQCVRQAAMIAAESGVPLFVDATAWNGSFEIDFRELGASLVALAPENFGGPAGCGVLWRRPGFPLVPLIHGGDQEFGLRAGVENVAAIVGAGVAAEITLRELPERGRQLREIQCALLKALTGRIDHIQLTGPPPGELRQPGHLSFVVEFVEGEGLALMLDLRGVSIDAGPVCISKSAALENPLHEMGIPPELSRGAIRLTLGRDNTLAEVEPAADAIARVVEKFRSMSPDWEDFTAGRRKALLPAR
jgi:cysteine desulfurase